MKKNKLFLISLLLVILISTLTGCGGSPRSSTGGNKWLSLSTNTSGARYIVDSSGQPFHLFAMARAQYHASDLENPAYGGVSGVAQHFKNLGCNSMRLAISFNTNWDQTTDRIVQCGGYNETGIQNYITKYVDPDVQAIIKKGMYVVLDLHMYPPNDPPDDPDPALTIQYARDHYIPVWRELAKRYKDEPMIAVYELWNEPHPADAAQLDIGPDGKIASGTYQGYDYNSAVRQFYIDCAAAVREYDTNHILLVSDCNAGWGTSWAKTWGGIYKDAADPAYKKVIYSIHANKEHLEDYFSYYTNYWPNTASNNNICLIFGEIETWDNPDWMTATAMQNYVNMLIQRTNSHHFSSMFWRPKDDVSNWVSYWSGFAKGYNSFPDVSQWFFEAETSNSANFDILSNANYFSTTDAYPGSAVQLKGSVPQYSYGTVTLSKTFTPGTYEIRIRSHGTSGSAASQGLYYEATDGSQNVIAFINGRTDGNYYTDSYVIMTTKPFNKLILKKTESSSSACNPVDRFVVLSDARVEAEYAYPSTDLIVYNLSTASNGQTAGIKGTSPIWTYAKLTWGGYFSPDTYIMTVRLYGDPANAAQQGIYYLDWAGNHNNLGYINGRTDGNFYTVTYTFTTAQPFSEIAFKKSVTSSQGTNPIDNVAIERQ